MVKFLYAVKVDVTEDEATDLYELADFYDIPDLRDLITGTTPSWSDKNLVVKLCAKIPNFEKSGNFSLCREVIIKDFEKLDLSPLTYEAMEHFLKSDDIAAPEVQIFKMLLQWQVSQTTDITKERIENLSKLIRYGTMSLQELAQVVSPTQY